MNIQVRQTLNDLAIVNSHYVEMIFFPIAWQAAAAISPTWHFVDFPPQPRNAIPNEPGVYVFVVTPNVFDFDLASGLLYVGKATNLYSRIGAYMAEIDKDFKTTMRPHVWRMINQWHGYLKFYFTCTPNVAAAEDLENEMLKALRPPFNKEYEAQVSRVMRAL
jgi:excinuclease UvrABC nuclease subunit